MVSDQCTGRDQAILNAPLPSANRAQALKHKGDGSYHWKRCEAHLGKGDLDRAMSECTEAIRIKPESWESLNTLARVLVAKGDHDRALKVFADPLLQAKDTSDRLVALAARGAAFEARGELDLARADFRIAAQFKPDATSRYERRAAAMVRERLIRLETAPSRPPPVAMAPTLRPVVICNADQPDCPRRRLCARSPRRARHRQCKIPARRAPPQHVQRCARHRSEPAAGRVCRGGRAL